jgi:hypothetical protein
MYMGADVNVPQCPVSCAWQVTCRLQAGRAANERRMHVLIDLVGYTGGGERANEIFASRPAALQARAGSADSLWQYMARKFTRHTECSPFAPPCGGLLRDPMIS